MKSFVKDLVEVMVTSLIIVFVLINFIILPVQVDGSSMLTTLHDGDRGIGFVFKKFLTVQRFDIVVIDSPVSENKLVKRVIGLPGETIAYRDGLLYINDEYVEEDFLNDVYTEAFTVTLGEDEYYCLGDNRGNSRDSRYYGAFHRADFRCLGMMVLYPFDRFGLR